jgi:hypothetical protein
VPQVQPERPRLSKQAVDLWPAESVILSSGVTVLGIRADPFGDRMQPCSFYISSRPILPVGKVPTGHAWPNEYLSGRAGSVNRVGGRRFRLTLALEVADAQRWLCSLWMRKAPAVVVSDSGDQRDWNADPVALDPAAGSSSTPRPQHRPLKRTGAETPAELFQLMMAPEVWVGLLVQANDLATRRLVDSYPPALGDGPLEARIAFDCFTAVIDYLRGLIKEELVDVSPAGALDLIRAMPLEIFDFDHRVRTIALQNRYRAELLTTHYAGLEFETGPLTDDSRLEKCYRVTYAAALAAAESRAVINRMQAARGVDWDPINYRELSSLELTQSMRLFTERQSPEAGFGDEGASGSLGTLGLRATDFEDSQNLLFLVPRVPEHRRVMHLGSIRVNHNFDVRLRSFDLGGLLSELSGDVSAAPLLDEVYSLLVLASLLSDLARRRLPAMASLINRGYVDLATTEFLGLARRAVNRLRLLPASYRAEQALETLLASTADPETFRGRAVLAMARGVRIDATVIASRLEQRVGELLSADFGMENRRADHFEHVLQNAIDASPWMPPEDIRKLHRIPLEFDGKTITDLDGIGFKNGALLAVDAKSFRQTAAYNARDFRDVRNVETNLREALIKWQKKMRFLQSNPKGANYDLTSVTSVIAVVCTPEPSYVRLPEGARSWRRSAYWPFRR